MQKGGNILALGKALDKTLAEFEADVPRGIVIARVADQPKVVDAAVFEFTRSFLEALAIKRMGRPEDLAGLLAFLVSDAGEWVTGQTIHVNGGFWMRPA